MITETEIGLLATTPEGKGLIFLKKAVTCGCCKREVMILVNENGRTRCTTCPEDKP